MGAFLYKSQLPASFPILVQFKVLSVTHVRNHAGLVNKTKNKIFSKKKGDEEQTSLFPPP